ncbi:DNA polymerase III subunit epsilon [Halioglobus japonicus]|uniref:DNA polymerase III subunit epsilon n=1 Tax=Halioglobus japonicus TaxID=930805 RepID=A0AAP8MIB0_9GAMM|nr:DNA polymerase III subunit epsilon [Halioglobus japonicus]AQA18928.1 DNA polymerase III subunit epsilon [Halioglobus japonicus]PLW88057.1 DNA polymerase III subunit epsilon [Halioglobus japonicus]GHD20623.1 DNA polymerase III subunit epsilon [Halioglobus japonicus]
MRQIVLDTETTGLEVTQGHRIIEIGCVELDNRRLTGNHYHVYINPQREVDQGAIEVHGITNEFLADKPLFARVAQEFFDFVKGAELVIHNAPFDVGFLDAELKRLDKGYPPLSECCSIVDSLILARAKHPGQRNNLDALCSRYGVDNSSRDLHGALLDAEILADVYLTMTGGQTSLTLSDTDGDSAGSVGGERIQRLSVERRPLKVIEPSAEELAAHEAQLEAIAAGNGGKVLWREQG